MSFEIDVAGTVSGGLATVIDAELNNTSAPDPVTLGAVRDSMRGGLVAELIQSDVLPSDEDDTIFAEIETLIETYGDERPAQDFVRYRVSEDLAVVFQSALDSHAGDQPPTLGSMREAINAGLVANLVGIGDIDPDEDETLLAELQRLIVLNGEDAPAEEFLP